MLAKGRQVKNQNKNKAKIAKTKMNLMSEKSEEKELVTKNEIKRVALAWSFASPYDKN